MGGASGLSDQQTPSEYPTQGINWFGSQQPMPRAEQCWATRHLQHRSLSYSFHKICQGLWDPSL